MKQILIPVDFSDCSEKAVKVGLELAVKKQLKVHFLHVAETMIDWEDGGFLSNTTSVFPSTSNKSQLSGMKEGLEKARVGLDALVQKAKGLGLESGGHLRYGAVHQGILEKSNALNVDLLVMGTHGLSGFREAFIGSNVQRVVRQASFPVLMVREPAAHFSIDHVVFASDFEEEETMEVLTKVKVWAAFFESRVHLLFVNTPGRFMTTAQSLEKMDEMAGAVGLENYSVNVYNDYMVETGILAFTKHMNGDLIMIAPHGYEGFRRVMHNNITETIVNHSHYPVLTINWKK